MKKPTIIDLKKQKEDLLQQISEVDLQIERQTTEFDYTTLHSFEKCCEVTGDDPNDPKFQNEDTYEMCKVIVKAINHGKELGKKIYFPWFDRTKKPGSGFFYGGSSCYYWDDYAVSVRVAHATSDRAIFGAKTFEKIYYPHITGKKLPE